MLPLTGSIDRPLDPAARAWAGRWVPLAYLGVAVALIPWTLYLAVTLPVHATATHYRLAWVGFDVILIVVLARIGWFAWRRDPRVVLTAAAGATLLAADAWFDVTTAVSAQARTGAIVAAVLLELPGALLCMALARRGLATLMARASASPRP
ncbi:hypothetical protein [Nocardioides nematodiphilus]|uniref:hypothetical protein n=1 Tax=Nocardioides nematodiphilus TaxID=2849669 RepID=UPI001CD9C665|nr:hypothetical protein [Nocardioides nematodiphilus]MCA1982052.1 hypothetical protein [Nocardioides nematodiphilus]